MDPSILMADQLLRLIVLVGLSTAVICCVVSLFALAGYTIWMAYLRA